MACHVLEMALAVISGTQNCVDITIKRIGTVLMVKMFSSCFNDQRAQITFFIYFVTNHSVKYVKMERLNLDLSCMLLVLQSRRDLIHTTFHLRARKNS